MTQFSKEIASKGVGKLLLSALMLLCAASCTEVDDSLGTNIVPSGQKFEVKFATLSEGIESYLTYTDSISTGSLDYAYFGKMTDREYGSKVTSSALVQFAYSMRTDTIDYEGYESKFDSLSIVLGMKTVGGDTLKEQTFDIYRVRKMLERDSTYYNGTNIGEYIDSEPMFSCTFRGRPNGATEFDTLRLSVKNQLLAEEFIEQLWGDTTLYSNDTLFLKEFNGLCITPSGESPDDAAIYGMNLQWSVEEGPMSYLILYGHEEPTSTASSQVEDEIMRAFAITNNTSYSYQKAVTAVEYDFSAMEGGAAINYDATREEPLTNPVEKGYVQGFMGVATTLELSEEFVSSLRALRPEGCSILINKATLYVDLEGDDYTLYDIAPERLGTYANYSTLYAVPDYAYLYEENYETEIVYGGYLNRTFGYYTMDLSLYLQSLLGDENDEVTRRITLGMGAYDLLDDAIVRLDMNNENQPVRFEITYTIIGK